MGFTVVTPITMTAADTPYAIFSGHRLVKTLSIQQKYNNQGVLFIGTSGLKPSTDTEVIKQLPVPTPTGIPAWDYDQGGNEAPNPTDIGEIFVASTQGGDIAYVSYDIQ